MVRSIWQDTGEQRAVLPSATSLQHFITRLAIPFQTGPAIELARQAVKQEPKAHPRPWQRPKTNSSRRHVALATVFQRGCARFILNLQILPRDTSITLVADLKPHAFRFPNIILRGIFPFKMNTIMSWPQWFNPTNWDNQSSSWFVRLDTDKYEADLSQWLPFSEWITCRECKAAYRLYCRYTDFDSPPDIVQIKATVVARIKAHHPQHPTEIHGVLFGR